MKKNRGKIFFGLVFFTIIIVGYIFDFNKINYELRFLSFFKININDIVSHIACYKDKIYLVSDSKGIISFSIHL